jgi:hypothetical protein
MSGQYGASPEAQNMYRQMDAGMQGQRAGAQMGPAMATPGQNPAPPPQQQQQFNPMMQAQILDYLMKMMQQRAQSGQKATISTGGIY